LAAFNLCGAHVVIIEATPGYDLEGAGNLSQEAIATKVVAFRLRAVYSGGEPANLLDDSHRPEFWLHGSGLRHALRERDMG
jgi:hypothetical protein